MFEYKVIVCDKTGIIKDENSFTKTERKIVAENDKLIVIDDDYFSRIEKVGKKKYALYPALNEPSISIYINDSCWGNRITYTLYSFSSTIKPSKIRKDIEKAVSEKFGFFAKDINLDFIK